MRVQVRKHEHESVFQNSTKQLKFVSARIESVSTERELSAGARAVLKNYVTKHKRKKELKKIF